MSNTNKKTSWKSYLVSLVTAGAIYATTLPWFQSGIGENLAVVVHVWAWMLVVVGLLAVVFVGSGTVILLWFSGELNWDDDKEAFEKAADGFTEIKPKYYRSIPLTVLWIFALASTTWTGLLGTYVVSSVLMYVVVFWLVKSLRETAEKLKGEWEQEDNTDEKPKELRNLRKH